MTQDVLPLIRPSLPLLIIDTILSHLTHPSPTRRRSTLLVLFFSIPTILFLLHLLSPTSPPLPTPHSREAFELSSSHYTPLPPTAQQLANHARLTSLIYSRRNSSIPSRPYTQHALKHDNHKSGTPVTAVLLNWKRLKGVKLNVEWLSTKPFIREIIVWNNFQGYDLTHRDFNLSSPASGLSPPVLRIFNSPSNTHDLSKHLACSLASNAHCYFQDDDWFNPYLDSMFTKYLECCSGGRDGEGVGARIVTSTIPWIAWEQRKWRVENHRINLHTGFTWLGTGSFFPRRFSTNFLSQQSYLSQLSLSHPTLDLTLSESETLVSDMFFSIWTNSYPEQWSTELVEIDVEGGEVGWSKSNGIDQWTVVYENLLKAYRILSVALLESPNSPNSPFPSTPPDTLFPSSHSRAPCSNDECIFITNLSPFPSPSSIDPIFNDKIRSQSTSNGWFNQNKISGQRKGLGLENGFDPFLIPSLKSYEQLWDSLPPTQIQFPSVESFISHHSWHFAVDSISSTCFDSSSTSSSGGLRPLDYFGLSFLKGRVVRVVEIEGVGLGGVVSWDEEDEVIERGEEGWVVMTKRWNGGGGWEPRQLVSSARVTRLDQGRERVSFELVEIKTPTTYTDDPERGNYEVMEEGEVRVGKLKLVRIGKGRAGGKARWTGRREEDEGKLSVCGWKVDGWEV
ncbi:hypothetical protein JCM5353_001541 [Sporobolomyces roseus]